jgi:hypothetical protein
MGARLLNPQAKLNRATAPGLIGRRQEGRNADSSQTVISERELPIADSGLKLGETADCQPADF